MIEFFSLPCAIFRAALAFQLPPFGSGLAFTNAMKHSKSPDPTHPIIGPFLSQVVLLVPFSKEETPGLGGAKAPVKEAQPRFGSAPVPADAS
jgi:hypothetical protein